MLGQLSRAGQNQTDDIIRWDGTCNGALRLRKWSLMNLNGALIPALLQNDPLKHETMQINRFFSIADNNKKWLKMWQKCEQLYKMTWPIPTVLSSVV